MPELQTKRIPGRTGTAPAGQVPTNEKAPEVGGPKRQPMPTERPIGDKPLAPMSKPKPQSMPRELASVIEAAASARDELMRKPHVIDVRGGYKFINGRITDLPAVVVVVDRKVRDLAPHMLIPPALASGIPTDVAPADPYELVAALREKMPEEAAALHRPRLFIDEIQPGREAWVEEAIREITYEPPPNGDLDAVTGAMTVICHVSPDCGWSVLKPFLERTEREVRLGMYDFTAPHIYRTARSLLKDGDIEWRQTLGPKESLPGEDDVDSTKANDLPEQKIVDGLRRVTRDRFLSAFAHVGAGQTFASAYHIKLAVRDRKSFWLSSGNWQSSNQPDIDFLDADADRSLIPRYNREWHAVVENAELARKLRVYLEHDFATAREPVAEAAPLPRPDLLVPVDEYLAEEKAAADLQVFVPQKFIFSAEQPLTIQPILTPDNYIQEVGKLLRERPEKSLYFQNQSLNPILKPTDEFRELMDLLSSYSRDQELDVRLIFRNIGPIRKKIESLKAYGFDMKRVRVQAGCHTKGIIIDSKVVLIGSHNFTNEGLQVNRDASLLIRHEGIAQYYERVFLHDWMNLSRDTIREEAMPIPDGIGAEATAEDVEYVRVPWSELDED
jgi:hypothetical protein